MYSVYCRPLRLLRGVGDLTVDDAVSARVHRPHHPAHSVHCQTQADGDEERDEKYGGKVVATLLNNATEGNVQKLQLG